VQAQDESESRLLPSRPAAIDAILRPSKLDQMKEEGHTEARARLTNAQPPLIRWARSIASTSCRSSLARSAAMRPPPPVGRHLYRRLAWHRRCSPLGSREADRRYPPSSQFGPPAQGEDAIPWMNVPSQPFHSQLGGELVQPRYVVRNEATRRQGERPRDDAPKAAASNAGYPRLRPVVTMLRGPTADFRRRRDLLCPVEQASRDTDAAISRLFQILPDLDAIEIRVLEPHSPNRLVFAGTVVREDVLAARSVASPGMRLKLMGIRSHTTDGHLEPPD
jgi:hypothetical protein